MQNLATWEQEEETGSAGLAMARSYVLAAVCVGLAFLLRLVLDSIWVDHLPYATFFVAVLVVTRFAGAGRSGGRLWLVGRSGWDGDAAHEARGGDYAGGAERAEGGSGDDERDDGADDGGCGDRGEVRGEGWRSLRRFVCVEGGTPTPLFSLKYSFWVV